ncbi:MAG: hypothetical protein FWG79_03405 [Bacteroidales bacterium]|nr:hypothetical protein [Bacteroidales bacterium]
MKKLVLISVFLIVNFALFSQNVRSINANFEVDEQGWTSHQSVKWSALFPPMDHRHGISFSGESENGKLFLFMQKEVTDLQPNTNYRVMFNMNWVCKMEAFASPISVKIGRNEYDFIVAGQLKPEEFGRPFLENIQNLDNAFFVNTDETGRLSLMIGLESEYEKIEHIYLNTLRILLAENGEAREIKSKIISEKITETITENFTETITENTTETITETIAEPVVNPAIEEISSIVFVQGEDDLVFFESEFNHEVELLNIYTEDNHLIKLFTFRNLSDSRSFRTTGLPLGTYRIEFILTDGRKFNKLYTIK